MDRKRERKKASGVTRGGQRKNAAYHVADERPVDAIKEWMGLDIIGTMQEA
jgi:hypothetical protein